MTGASGSKARRELARFSRFLVVGAFGFAVDTGALSALVFLTALDRRWVKAIAFCLAVVSNFILNRLWAYKDSRSKPVLAQIAQFAAISAGGLGINVLVFGAVDDALVPKLGPVIALYAAQVAAVGCAMLWNFAANRFVTYGDVTLGH